MSSPYRVGIDIGGTFTDFVLLDEHNGGLHLHKCLSTPHDPAQGALQGLHALLAEAGLAVADLAAIVHGTTLVTNAVIERRGALTALLTTRGFRDLLEVGREQRYDIYDLFLRYPEPLVPRRRRLTIAERMDRDGRPLQVPDPAVALALLTPLVEEGLEALAICLLHAYRNPAHEQLLAVAIAARFPNLALSLSSQVAPEIHEYERTSTTVANAYVQPLIDRYLQRLETALAAEGFHGRLLLMQSSGGTITPETARRLPIRLLESGPAGGAAVTAFLGRVLNHSDLLAFDMGGTTAKACLIQQGRATLAPDMEAARVQRFKRGSGLPIRTPTVALIEIGAGGGSIAHTDDLGLLKVGPASAGAAPGPVCYGRGGSAPTVTDACLTLGYFDPAFFLGGAMQLDLAAAHRVLAGLGAQLGLDPIGAAWGVYQVVCEQMAAAARVHLIEQGCDPRRFPLLAFGGAGPAHAVQVARRLGITEVIVPPLSGVASALGFLVAPISFEFVRSYPAELRHTDWAAIAALYAELEQQAVTMLTRAGVPAAALKLERRVQMRLSGQFHDIDVPLPNGPLDQHAGAQLAADFALAYQRLYHALLPGFEPMALSWRLHAAGPELSPAAVKLQELPAATGELLDARKGRRAAYFAPAGFVSTPVYDRARLPAGATIAGPAMIEEGECTTVIGPGDRLQVDGQGCLVIKVGTGR